MDQKEPNPEKKWEISVKHLGSQKLKLPLQFANVLIRKRAQPKRSSRLKPFVKRTPTETKPKSKGKTPKKQKKPIVCYKCGKTGHKSNIKLSKN